MGGAGRLDQLDRLVDGGVVGGGVGEEQLVEAEPQGRQHRRVEQPGRAAGEPFDRGVGWCRGAARRRRRGAAPGRARGRRARARSASARKARSVKAPSSKVARIVAKARARAGETRPEPRPPAPLTIPAAGGRAGRRRRASACRRAAGPPPAAARPRRSRAAAPRHVGSQPSRLELVGDGAGAPHAEPLPAGELQVGADVRGQGADLGGQLGRRGDRGRAGARRTRSSPRR